MSLECFVRRLIRIISRRLFSLNTSSLFFLYAEGAFPRKEVDQTLPKLLFGRNEAANGQKTHVATGDFLL